MDLRLPIAIANSYTSHSQQIRVVSEYWLEQYIFCPNCGESLCHFQNNLPVADFFCRNCAEEYELKSKIGNVGKKIVNGAYNTMIDRLMSSNNPNFFFLTYNKYNLEVSNFFTIPKYFFVPTIIEQRLPLKSTARRAGWIGCNIIIENIPEFGKIFYIQRGDIKTKVEVLTNWNKTKFVKSTNDIDAKGWLLDVLKCVERIRKNEFTLDEVYKFEPYLKERHPQNNNVKAKIRQQLQLLRDKEVIDFIVRGKYRLRF